MIVMLTTRPVFVRITDMKKKQSVSRSNPVAKYARKFNRASTHVDKKKEAKKYGQLTKEELYPNNGF